MREVTTVSSRGAPTQRPLLAAKMTPPEPGDIVARSRLFAKLDGAAARPVTLVVAPAGWGKTVLLSSWLRSRAGESAWLTVDPDDHVEDLWSYVETGLRTPEWDARRVPSGDRDSLVHLVAAVADRPAPVTLVVDAAEKIADPDFVAGLDYLVGRADGRLRLILAARSARAVPAHRWRLRDCLAEFTADDLAFTTAEVIELFAAHGRALSADHADQVRHRTEGWPAGLRLMVLALAEQPEPVRLVPEVSAEVPEVTEYLTDEVLATLSPPEVEALTRCAIDERLCGGLLEAVTDGVDGEAVLSRARDTGFTVPVGARGHAYRHHRMLADVFHARLMRRPEPVVQDLERRAARWFADNDQPARALRHALLGQAWSLAESVLRQRWRELLPPVEVAGSAPPPPPTPEQVRARPALAMAYSADRLAAGDPDGADTCLRLADVDEHVVTVSRTGETALIAAALRLGRAQLAGDPAHVRAAAHRLLALAQPDPSTAPVDLGGRGIARIAEGTALLSAGQLRRAEDVLAAGVCDADDAGLPRIAGRGMSSRAVVQALRGRLGAAVDSAHRALTLLDADASADRAPAHLALGLVGLERDRPDEVAAHLIPATFAADPFVAALGTLTEAKCRADAGDPAAASRLIQDARRRLESIESPYLHTTLAVTEADLGDTRGDRGTGRGNLHRLAEAAAEPTGMVAVALARAHLRDRDPHAVGAVLAGWPERDDDSWPLPVRVAAGVLDAEAARQLADHRRAARLLEQVLALAEPEGFRRAFTRAQPSARELLGEHLDTGTAHWPLVHELLAADAGMSVQPDGRSTVLRESLTERELTVLRYLQSVLSNVEIARELSVSVNTVKTHVRSIYRKLDATRRRDAVRRARQFHLL